VSKLTKFLKDPRGFTLVEMLVGITLLSITMSTIGAGLFRALGTQSSVVDDGLAINELRKGLSWFAGDVKMATSTNLAIGGATSSSVTLSWKDQFNDVDITHTSTYDLVDDRLVRTYTSNATSTSHTIAHRVISVSFSLNGTSTVVAEVEVDARPGATRTLSLSTIMRAAR
jgi:prepilin-type N-terminal cleavage/methylation domain-containing protein